MGHYDDYYESDESDLRKEIRKERKNKLECKACNKWIDQKKWIKVTIVLIACPECKTIRLQ
jgi:Zn finger protein HypA/HybF involved in hydrogenase expression